MTTPLWLIHSPLTLPPEATLQTAIATLSAATAPFPPSDARAADWAQCLVVMSSPSQPLGYVTPQQLFAAIAQTPDALQWPLSQVLCPWSATDLSPQDTAHPSTLLATLEQQPGAYLPLLSTTGQLAGIVGQRSLADYCQQQTLQRLTTELELEVAERTRAIQESEARYRAVVEDQTDLICRFDADGVITFVNDAYCRYFGVERDTYIGQAFWHFIPEPDRATVLDILHGLSLERPTRTTEQRIVLPNGDVRWQTWTDRAIFDDAGNALEYQAVGRDITDRKRTEEALVSKATHLITAQRIAHIGSGELDPATGKTVLSEQALRIYGFDLTQSSPPLEVILSRTHPEDVHRLTQHLQDQLATQGTIDVQYRIHHPTQGLRHIQAHGEPVFDQQGELLRYVGTALDVTDRTLYEQHLQDLSVRLQLAMRTSGVGICDWCFEENQICWDATLYDLYGLPLNTPLTFEAWMEQIHPEDRDRVTAQLQQIKHDDVVTVTTDFRIVRPDGEIRYVEANVMMQRHPDGSPRRVLGTNLDITERKQVEVKLRRINAQVIEAARLKDEFLANMSHELRTPLNAVLGMAEALHEQVYGPLTPAQLKCLRTIENSGRHLLELINDLLDLSKIEAGKLQLNLAPVSLRSLCESSLAFVEPMARKKEIAISLDLPPEVPARLQGDERRLRQVLINLLSNAVKFTHPQGRVTLTVDLHPGPPFYPFTLRFRVMDTGIGIATEHLGNLFEPFTQVDSRLNRRQEGTGLGLALVKRLVMLHKGRVTVDSQPEQGSCFTVELPHTDAAVESGGAPRPLPTLADLQSQTGPSATAQSSLRSRPSSSTSSRALPLVLLAEDNDANADTITEYLMAKGYRLVRAVDGREALDLAARHQPQVILMDVQMPEMDGLEAIRHLRQTPSFKATPIIALTALAMPGDEARCLEAGASGYLSKPLRLQQLNQTLQQAIAAQLVVQGTGADD